MYVNNAGILVHSDDYLQHHGILGQKWGKQNGPPYPLGAGDHSASEKKAGWRKSLDGGSGMTYAQIANKLGVSESTVWAMLFDEE